MSAGAAGLVAGEADAVPRAADDPDAEPEAAGDAAAAGGKVHVGALSLAHALKTNRAPSTKIGKVRRIVILRSDEQARSPKHILLMYTILCRMARGLGRLA
jgi:hypothetical protein